MNKIVTALIISLFAASAYAQVQSPEVAKSVATSPKADVKAPAKAAKPVKHAKKAKAKVVAPPAAVATPVVSAPKAEVKK